MQQFGMPIARILTLGSYNCRCISGTSRLSDHARGDALDIAGVQWAGQAPAGAQGAETLVLNFRDPVERALLRRVNACVRLAFPRVLDYGFNRDHDDHFHVDMNGGRPRSPGEATAVFVQESLNALGRAVPATRRMHSATLDAVASIAGTTAAALRDPSALNRALDRLFTIVAGRAAQNGRTSAPAPSAQPRPPEGEEVLVRRLIAGGNRDVDRLTNAVFFRRHPERQGRAIAAEERQAAAEWIRIRDGIVRRVLSERAARPSPASDRTLATVEQYRPLAEAAGRRYGVDPALILGVIAAESGGNPNLVARSGYTGLMQAGTDPSHRDPAVSIDKGTEKLRTFRATMERVLAGYSRRYDELPEPERLRLLALAYNAGPVTVAKALQYASAAGRPERWLDPEHYKRALLFTGAYSLRQAAPSCLAGRSAAEHEPLMREASRVRDEFRLGTKRQSWQTLPDPPPWERVSQGLPAFLLCAIDFKHRHSPGYAAKILAYRDRFRRN
jgi:soluble lytic murein transglycosylase-like protein